MFPNVKKPFLVVVGFGVFPVPFSEGSSVPVTIFQDQGMDTSWGDDLHFCHEDVMGSLDVQAVTIPDANHSPLKDKFLMVVLFLDLSFKLLNYVVVEVVHV